MVRYAITNLEGYGSDRAAAEQTLLCRMEGWVAEGVEWVQLREKQLDAGELLLLAEKMVSLTDGSGTRVLVNGRPDVAVAAGAHGVHLTAHQGELRPDQVRQVFSRAHREPAIVSISCHTLAEVERAAREGVEYILFGPVFEKRVGNTVVVEGLELDGLKQAAQMAGSVPVLALGGVTRENTGFCLAHGARGVAGIRLFTPEGTKVQR